MSQNDLLQMDLRPSRLLLGLVLFSHGCALIAVLTANLPLGLRLAIVPIVLSCACDCLRQWRGVSRLQMSHGNISLQWNDHIIPVRLESDPWCSECLQVLRFRPLRNASDSQGRSGIFGKRRINVVIMVDSASADSRRRLRLLLRWHRFAEGVPV